MKIYIDHIADCNQNLIEYILNTAFLSGHFGLRLDDLRADPDRIFYTNDVTEVRSTGNNRIHITFNQDDLLHISQISLNSDKGVVKVGTSGDLSDNTYDKLSNKFYQSALDDIIKLSDVIPDLYSEIKGDNWPDITTITEFNRLPDEIKTECLENFGFAPKSLSATNPNVTRILLRKYFTKWFSADNHPLITLQKQVTYTDQNVYQLPFSDCQDTDLLLKHIDKIGNKFNLEYKIREDLPRNIRDIRHFHETFMSRYKWKHIKQQADDILDNIEKESPLDLTVMQEAYLNAKLNSKLSNLPRIDKTSVIRDVIG
jgi:hypothetical protein